MKPPGPGRRSGSAGSWRQPVAAAERARLEATLPGGGGLCTDCRHLRLVGSARTVYVRCLLAESDPAYERYPGLPVLRCAGYRAWRGQD